MMAAMRPDARVFLLTLAVSAGAAVLAGAAAALILSGYPPGSAGPHPALWLLVAVPVAAALAAAGALAQSMASVLVAGAAFLLPQVIVVVAGFFVFAHPGGAGGEGLLLTTAEFWLKLGAAYAAVTALVGAASLVFRLIRR
jgi:hypothetical protein